MTNEQHNRYIAYAFFANAGFYLLILVFMFAIFSTLFWDRPGDPAGPPPAFFAVMIAFITIFYGIFMLPSIIAGYALLKKKSWARIASIIAGIVAGMNFPIGTGACVYSLWFFFSENWKEVYEESSFRSFDRHRGQIAYGVESQRAAYEADTSAEHEFQHREPPDWR